MNWSKTQIVAFENDFRKRRFIESFFINSTPNVINKKSSDLFPNIYKATFGCDWLWYYVLIRFLDSTHSLFLLLLFYLHFIFLSYFTLLWFYSALSVLPYLMCLFNVISVFTTSSNHTRLVDFNAPLLESPFFPMKACCQLAETLVSFLLLQQLSEDFYYYLSCWLVLQHIQVTILQWRWSPTEAFLRCL